MKITIPRKRSVRFVIGKPKFTFKNGATVELAPESELSFKGTTSVLGVWYEDAAWGIRIVHREKPRAWVKDCKTGQPILREDARCLGRGKDGFYYWLKKGESIYMGEKSHASNWKPNEVP